MPFDRLRANVLFFRGEGIHRRGRRERGVGVDSRFRGDDGWWRGVVGTGNHKGCPYDGLAGGILRGISQLCQRLWIPAFAGMTVVGLSPSPPGSGDWIPAFAGMA